MPFDPPRILKSAARAAGARRAIAAAAAVAVLTLGSVGSLAASNFDFYVLALSWSPTYCVTDSRPDADQCATPDLGFVVHGLWPEHDQGMAPTNCPSSEPSFVNRSTLDAIADVVPNRGFAAYEWRTHGMCSGLSADAYFHLMREAAARVDVPTALTAPARKTAMSPSAIEAAFISANPGLTAGAMAVRCQGSALSEVRICFTKGLEFTSCPSIDRAACRSGSINVPVQ